MYMSNSQKDVIHSMKGWLYNRFIRAKRWSKVLSGRVLKPTIFIVGAQKAGTTALYSYLCNHPSVYSPGRKELSFFDQNVNYARGLKWYHSFFPFSIGRGARAISFEATPEYMYYPHTMERIKLYCPEARIIILLREPIGRAYSAWNMYRRFAERAVRLSTLRWDFAAATNMMLGQDPFPDFRTSITTEINALSSEILEPGVVRRGIYAPQVERVFKHFSSGQVLILESKELHDFPEKTLARVTSFIGIDDTDFTALVKSTKTNIGGYSSKEIPSDAVQQLREFYSPHNEDLFELIGRRFEWT